MQHLLVQSAVPVDLAHPSWQTTHVGRSYSPQFGYGKIDAGLIVENAESFAKRGEQVSFESEYMHINRQIPETEAGLRVHCQVPGLFGRTEHVRVTVSIRHTFRRDVEIDLISPNNVTSKLVASRPGDNSHEGFHENRFLSVAHW